jgi:ATPase subunit of ABC transporter with duplicated ATPase domains
VVGIIGGNGAGKSTLFRMIMQKDVPDGGRLELGETVVPMWVDQSREALDADKTVRGGGRQGNSGCGSAAWL